MLHMGGKSEMHDFAFAESCGIASLDAVSVDKSGSQNVGENDRGAI